MGITPTGLPYPEPTDPVAGGADAIKNLALAVDTKGLARHGFTISGGAGQSIPNNAVTAINFTTENVDTDGFGAVPATAYTIPAGMGGVYAMTLGITWAAGPGVGSWHAIKVGADGLSASAAGNPVVGHSLTLPLAAGATIGVNVYQVSGAPVAIAAASLNVYRVSL